MFSSFFIAVLVLFDDRYQNDGLSFPGNRTFLKNLYEKISNALTQIKKNPGRKLMESNLPGLIPPLPHVPRKRANAGEYIL